MPKRSNEFQTLLALIEKALAPKGAKVTESAIVGEDAREIDVLIEGKFGRYQMKVAVEAKDHKRKLDQINFESILAKYFVEGGIKVDKLVVVTRNGYTKNVRSRADKLGVELMTLQQANCADWAKRIRKGSFHFCIQPHVCGIEFDPPLNFENTKEMWQNASMHCRNGGNHGSPWFRANWIAFKHWLPNKSRWSRTCAFDSPSQWLVSQIPRTRIAD